MGAIHSAWCSRVKAPRIAAADVLPCSDTLARVSATSEAMEIETDIADASSVRATKTEVVKHVPVLRDGALAMGNRSAGTITAASEDPADRKSVVDLADLELESVDAVAFDREAIHMASEDVFVTSDASQTFAACRQGQRRFRRLLRDHR